MTGVPPTPLQLHWLATRDSIDDAYASLTERELETYLACLALLTARLRVLWLNEPGCDLERAG